MKKSEILRSRDLFKLVALEGRRFDSRFLRCNFLIHHQYETPLQVAFKVPSRHFDAVRRNRIKRLMREGFSRERSLLDASLRRSKTNLAMFFTFKSLRDIPVELLKLKDVQPAIGEACRAIASKLQPDA